MIKGSLTSSQMGCFISLSTWQALVVTELTPEHHSTEKSQGWFTTYRLTEMLSRWYCLHRDSCGQSSRHASFCPQLCSKGASWINTTSHPLLRPLQLSIPKKPRRESTIWVLIHPLRAAHLLCCRG
uniref:Uncharacterized protein n=1 Tax=Melopsittacus undulatus TaxID=13146 RepID=A0A8C6JSE5_MELUD